MCQGQISFQKTYKWAMETRGPKSNSPKFLCLSWLPATLTMIRSKMNEIAIALVYGKCFRPQGQLTLQSVVQPGQNSNLYELLCMSLLHVPASIKLIGSKTTKKRWRQHFSHYKSMGAFIAMETRVLSQSALKPYVAIPPPQRCYT